MSSKKLEIISKERTNLKVVMPHPKENELIPIDAVVKIISGINKGKKARIKEYNFVKDNKGF